MNALAPISDKLDPLVRRLASDEDGEVVACVRAISRQLENAGLSFHDLADRLTVPDSAADSDVPPVFRLRRGRRVAPGGRRWRAYRPRYRLLGEHAGHPPALRAEVEAGGVDQGPGGAVGRVVRWVARHSA